MNQSEKKVKITFLPQGRTTYVPAETTVFDAAAWIGLPIQSTCGGRRTCGRCKVRLSLGAGSVTPAEREHLSEAQIAAGWRLSCQAKVHGETIVELPRLMVPPKAAVMGVGREVLLEPNVHKVHLQLPPPSLEDQRSDLRRLKEALLAEGFALKADLNLWRRLPHALREGAFEVTAVLVGDQLIGLEKGDTSGMSYGLAFDVGTTTVVGTLLDLNCGEAVAVASALNGQAVYGADIISRISLAMTQEDGVAKLQDRVVETINHIIDRLLGESDVAREKVYEMTVVGNSTMLHLLLGLHPGHIAVSPFVPVLQEAVTVKARRLRIRINQEALVYFFPLIGGYVGGDAVAVILATGLLQEDRVRLVVDVGTNSEVILGSAERALACAVPAGPAFEGAQITCGMLASEGAIEGLTIGDDGLLLSVIGQAAPVGLCGSGLIDAVAQLRRWGLIDETGRLLSRDEAQGLVSDRLAERLVSINGDRAFVLARADETGGDPILLTQQDVRELQLAKGALAMGIEILRKELSVSDDQIDEVLLAGAFGSYVNPESARMIGMVPPLPIERIVPVGNAAEEGAKMALLSFRERRVAESIPAMVEYVELSAHPDFNEKFVSGLHFPKKGGLDRL